jgi:calpain-15
MRLIEQGITPSDIGQGQLGDCWLLSALACLAEYPGAIAECLTDAEYSPRGKYGVRLFHPLTGKRQTVRGTLTIL